MQKNSVTSAGICLCGKETTRPEKEQKMVTGKEKRPEKAFFVFILASV